MNNGNALSRFIPLMVGLFFCFVGWTGVAVLSGFTIYLTLNWLNLNLSYETGFAICVALGGFFGAIPFAMIGIKWAEQKIEKRSSEKGNI